MSAQLLICKFAVFTCVSFFLPMPRVTRMARWLAGSQFVKTQKIDLALLCSETGKSQYFVTLGTLMSARVGKKSTN